MTPSPAALAAFFATCLLVVVYTDREVRMPDTFKVAAKFWAALVAAVLVAVQTAWDGAPAWLAPVIAGLGAVVVYLTPNEAPYEPRHGDEQ